MVNSRAVEILASGLFVFLATYLLTVPGRALWSPVSDRVDIIGLILGLVGACAVFGAILSWLGGVRFENVLVGGIVVYFVWGLYLEVTRGPFDSPVHIYAGGLFLAGFGAGARLVEEAERRGILRRRRSNGVRG